MFQIMYQVKMLTTAVLSVTMLRKRLRPSQWGAVAACMGGLVLVQLSQLGTGVPTAVSEGWRCMHLPTCPYHPRITHPRVPTRPTVIHHVPYVP